MIEQPQDPPLVAPPKSSGIRNVFIGPAGIRAGWSILIFVCLFAILEFAISKALSPIASQIQPKKGVDPSWWIILLSASVQIAGVATATYLMSRIEKRRFTDYWLRPAGAASRFAKGAAVGMVSIAVLVATLWACGLLSFDRINVSGPAILGFGLAWLVTFLALGIIEENLNRGYLHFTLTRGLNFWWSSIITTALFALAHSRNGGESPVGLAGVVAVALFLCLSLRLTGSLYFAIGFHLTWDWSESFLYGVPDSGMVSPGRLLATHPMGNPLWSGGSAGPEGSLLLIPTIALAAAVCWWLYSKSMPKNLIPGAARTLESSSK